jgi:hypothetical protein
MTTRNAFLTAPLLAGLIFSLPYTYACSVSGEVSSAEMVRQADAIVRASAGAYAVRPRSGIFTSGEPESKIRFKVLETIRGSVPSEIILPGALSEGDDFNDQPVPYNFVRPGGRHGSCFAYYYRAGAEFLFMLKKQQTGEYTVYWYALGPVNEQLRSTDDPWLLWVRKMAKK